ncbi:MAG: MFS transporter [Verrucomicrobiota bacterium]|jgi:POT family proton-dependent oligopeptide transporter|nr:MFS transporter [Verrucomicrobiota bacterium]OQC66970.1 MAG: Di-/tripeptide transporter [Verrucomicrobia bacterium ADurb.Bin006]HNY81061.1 MFS transporter [Sedimentisphaerales bacterium]NMD21713.1 POT family MFS transporter [Verrucomicrobiota bacterium]OQC66989.1 MAG: Di-/tripeptide transporter [Verrucomicrobia bacterium ADurb.Bin006]
MSIRVSSANRFPPPIKFIIGNEACERFSYYGIRSILALYISTVLFQHLPEGQARDNAAGIIHLFIFANYFTPLLGGIISDKFWGRYNTILYVSLVYCLGNLTLALTAGSIWGLYVGLFLIALGSGGIKPCVSAFCGDQFKPDQAGLLQKAYGLFYWSINFGSFFSFLVIPWIKDSFEKNPDGSVPLEAYRWAFGVPGILMLMATLIFWLGRKYYVRIPPSSETKSAGFFQVFWHALASLGSRQAGQTFWDAARAKFSAREVDAAKSVGPILMVFAPVTIFWALFDQTTSTWVMQGDRMIPFPVLGSFQIGAEQMQSMNPAFVMLLVPLTLFLYPRIEKWFGIRVSPLRRMGMGMFLAGFSYLVVGFIQTQIDAGGRLSVLWQALPYLILTTAEVLISTTGLEFAFTQAAAEMKSTIMSFWLLTVAVGNLYVPLITKLRGAVIAGTAAAGEGAAVNAATFYLYAGLTLAVALLFVFIATRYKERSLELTSASK